jgi:uncharacterized protein (TIGR02145 family)
MATAYICSNNPAHVFSERTADFYCPTCSIEDKSILFIRDEGHLQNKLSLDIETDQLLSEENNLENQGPTNNEGIQIPNPINISVEALVPDGEILDKIEIEEIIPEVVATDVMKIGNHTWMNDYLQIKDLDGLSFAGSPEDWKEAQVLKKPVYCFPNDDEELGSSLGLLYNWYAVQLISMNPPNGFRIPNSNDIIDLNQAILQTQEEFLAIDFAFQQKIPIAHRLPLATYADGTIDRCFWTSEQNGFYTAFSYRINLENNIARTRKIDKNAGYFIRCIQNS